MNLQPLSKSRMSDTVNNPPREREGVPGIIPDLHSRNGPIISTPPVFVKGNPGPFGCPVNQTASLVGYCLTLPPIHKDPFDRMLIAQAIVEGITLLTADIQVAKYPGPVKCV